MTWSRTLSLVAVLSLVALLGFGLTLDPSAIPSPLVGSEAPEFRLPPLEGGDSVGLSDFRGEGVVLNFWASWCLACIQEHPALVRAWETYRDEGVELIGVIYQDTPAGARRYLERYGGGWLQLLDPGSRAAIGYGVYGVPETFFIDRQGLVSHKHLGPVTDDLMTREIDKLLVQAPEAPGGTP